MKRAALLGTPIGHSVSPAMQRAAFQAVNLSWSYEALDTPPSRLAGVVQSLRGNDWIGANVTVPYKERVLGLLDEVDAQASAVGAVNTIVSREGVLRGFNTDSPGLLADLAVQGVDPAGRVAVVLGSGGGARAVAFAMASAGAFVQILCRSQAPGQELAGNLRRRLGVEVAVHPWRDASFAAIAGGSLVFHATPVGMWPDTASPWPEHLPLPEGAFVYDLVYNPPRTRLMLQAQRSGVSSANGLGMLVEQGALAFEHWTGHPAPRPVMRLAAERALEAICA
jgi:shikimate dehydrogenase